MRVFVIGGANMDICATTAVPFVARDSNPGTVRTSPGGVGRNIAHNLALLGDEVELLTIFGDDSFGRMLREHCAASGIGTRYSSVESGARNACFVSVNDSDGELLGGVADMAVTGLMTPQWLESRLDAINKADAVVADTNLSAETLSLLVASCLPPLYLDAVSSAKASRLKEALATTRLHPDPVFALKCNRLEAESLGVYESGRSFGSKVSRLYVSKGSDGVAVREDGNEIHIPAVPSEGIVNTTGAGDALLAGIVHAGPEASAVEAARFGVRCASLAMRTAEAVNEDIKRLIYE